MSQRLIKPGLPAAGQVYPKWHSKAGQSIEPLGFLSSGQAVWPVLGGAEEQDDPDADPEDDEDEEDEDEEEEEDDKKKKSSKSKKDDDEEDDEEDEKQSRPERQAARYRTRLRAQEKENADLKTRLRALEDKDKKPDEVASRDLIEARSSIEKLTGANKQLTAQLAFFQANTVTWADPADAFALADREGLFDDVVDEDGNVDARELRRGLKDLAKRKPHLVKKDEAPKARGRKDADTDDEDADDEPGPSSKTMNGKRKGTKSTTDRAALARKFPVLGRF